MKERLDVLLVDLGYFADIREAASNIMIGNILINEKKIDKAGALIKLDEKLDIRVKGKKEKYVSRGGLKLEKAITKFNLDFSNALVLDVGASTGGFTHCALEHGASQVYAIDVGTNQLHWTLRNNPKVKSIENMHINNLELAHIEQKKIDYITIDVSFISIKNIINSVKKFVSNNTKLVILLKPQFEAEKDEVEKGGVVKKIHVHEKVIHDIILVCEKLELFIEDLDFSPIKGAKGNIEYILLFSSNSVSKEKINVQKVVEAAKILGGKYD